MAIEDHQAGWLYPGIVLANRYQLLRLIGSGTFGDVYLATDLHLDHPVAVKVLRLHQMQEREKGLRLFKSEAKLAVGIDHPNVVRVMDLDRYEGVQFLVMEYLDGSDLAALLAEVERLPTAVAVRTLREALLGLGALHELLIVHRDLKPRNILLRRHDNRVKLSDFGLAKSLDAASTTTGGAVVGTPLYMAPEVWDRQPATPASDVFAMGVILFELLTGNVPWDTRDIRALIQSVQRDAPSAVSQRLKDVPPEIDVFLSACLAKDPLARPPDASAAEGELQRLGINDLASPEENRLFRNRVAIVGLGEDLRRMVQGCLGASGLLSPVVAVPDIRAPELLRGLGHLDAILLDPQCRPPSEIGQFINQVREKHPTIVFFLLLRSRRDHGALSGFSSTWQARFDHFFEAYLDTALAELPRLAAKITRLIVLDQTIGLSK